MKLRLTVALIAAMGMGAAVAQDTTSDKGKVSYAIGYEIGRDFTEKQMDIDLQTVIKAIQDGYAKRNPTVAEADMRAALGKLQEQMLAKAKAEFEKVSSENKSKSDQFLSQNRSKPGVTVLPSGVQYKVIEDGNGGRPGASSEVQIHFRGSLATGLEFASTYTGNNPVTMKVSDAPIEGLKEVLPLMKAGSRWEVFMPPERAYGDSPRSPIGPNQAVVFDVKLVSVK